MAHRVRINPHPLSRGEVKVESDDRRSIEMVLACYELGRVVTREYAGDWKKAVEVLKMERHSKCSKARTL